MSFSSQLKMLCFSRGRKKFLVRLAFDLLCISLLAAGLLSIKFGASPYHRGFFCDDESIKHPVLKDTVTAAAAGLVGAILPIVTIIIVEALFRKSQNLCLFSQPHIFMRKRTWMMSAYDYISVFIFGMAINQFLTDIGKFSVGRLRPHFLSLCEPDFSKIDCTQGYITDDVCTSTDESMLKEARLSFPSGHSSYSMYCMLYAILYLQTRFTSTRAPLLKPTLQVVFFCLGFYCCLSRISDYKHHWSDVLAGAILGMVVCICVVRSLTDFGKVLFVPRTVTDAQLCSVTSLHPSSDDANSDTSNDHGFGSISPSRASEGRVKSVSLEIN